MIPMMILAAAAASGPSFDCARASHPLERTICADAELSRLDAQLAAAYRKQMGTLFDTAAFKGQQIDFQTILRNRCKVKCSAAAVRNDYRDQLQSITGNWEESWNDEYKTATPAYLTLTHQNAQQFTFGLIRSSVDDQDKALCTVPSGTIARMSTPAKASAQLGSCRIDFALTRDTSGSVTRIDVSGTAGCARMCTRGYAIDGVYTSANNWVASNQ